VLLRNLADEIERRALEFEGHSVRLSDSLEAVVDLTEGGQAEVSLIDVRLEHPAPAVWNLTELHQALAHPGD
jgi:hypothetical protein